MIKPEFFDDEKLASISRDARLLFTGLWIYSDDYGVVKGNPKWLRSKIFPYDEIDLDDFVRWLWELEQIDCLKKFFHNGETYYYIRTFLDHQIINKPSQTRNPAYSEPLPHQCTTTPAPLPHQCTTTTAPLPHQCTTTPAPLPSQVEIETETELEVEVETRKDLSADGAADCPSNGFNLQVLAKMWNHKAPPELPKVKIPFIRKPQKLNTLQDNLKRNPDRQFWENLLETIYFSSFMRGKNNRGWKATFDFVVENANEITDGKYIDNGFNELSREEKNYLAAQEFVAELESSP